MRLNRYVRQAVLYNIKNRILHKIVLLCNNQFIENNLKSILHIKKYYIYYALKPYFSPEYLNKIFSFVKSILEDDPDIIDYRSKEDLNWIINHKIKFNNIKLYKYLFDLIVLNGSIKIFDIYNQLFVRLPL